MSARRLLRAACAAAAAAWIAPPLAAQAPAARPAPGARVVCVSKQLNEFLYAIGAQRALVGRDLTSTYPAAITALPSVGYHRALSADGILSLRPSSLLTDGNVGPEAVVAQVRQVGVPVIELQPGRTTAQAQAVLRQLGAMFGRAPQAEAVIARWTRDLAAVAADTLRDAAARRPRVLVMHFGQLVNDYLAVTRGGPADEAIRLAGGVNAVDSIGGMLRLTPELIAKAAPDVIVATDAGFDRAGSVAAFAQLPGVALTPAARAGRIHRIDETALLYFGPRTPATVTTLRGWVRAARGR